MSRRVTAPAPAQLAAEVATGRIAVGGFSTSGKDEVAGGQGGLRPDRRPLRDRREARFAPPAERLAHRTETGPLLEAVFDWAESVVAKLSAKSALVAAFRYTIERRGALTRFVTDARLEIDSNIAEN
jgi:hypothetical protein